MHQDQGIRSNMWRWWCGGSVIAIAVVIGCATAVDFRRSGREAGSSQAADRDDGASAAEESAKVSFGTKAKPGREPAHNGGKVRMPVEVSFDGEPSVTVTRDTVVEVSVAAEADISNIQGVIEGIDGLEGVRQPLSFTELGSGETRRVSVAIPAKNGRLLLRIQGVVAGGMEMTTGLELEVKNPKETSSSGVSAQSVRKSSVRKTDTTMDAPVSQDSNGQVVQPMRATEN